MLNDATASGTVRLQPTFITHSDISPVRFGTTTTTKINLFRTRTSLRTPILLSHLACRMVIAAAAQDGDGQCRSVVY